MFCRHRCCERGLEPGGHRLVQPASPQQAVRVQGQGRGDGHGGVRHSRIQVVRVAFRHIGSGPRHRHRQGARGPGQGRLLMPIVRHLHPPKLL